MSAMISYIISFSIAFAWSCAKKAVKMNIKCSGNLTQNHARIHGPFKDIFLVSYTALFNKKRLRRSNDKIVHHNHCDEVGPI
jgi:hypothetical protein